MLTEKLVWWMVEREAMRRRKELKQPPPYSENHIMANTRFTNVRREHDKVTRYLANSPWRREWHPNMPARMTLARMVNYIPSLKNILESWESGKVFDDWRVARMVLDQREELNRKVWSSAYTITTCGRYMRKVPYVTGHVVPAVAALGPLPAACTTLAATYKWLRAVDGLGSFLAAQVVADLKNIEDGPLFTADDWYIWSAPGPGSLKGLTALFGYNVTASTYHAHITKAWAEVLPLLPEDLQDISMQDFQNCLCEFSKLVRIENGGHVRNHYKPGAP